MKHTRESLVKCTWLGCDKELTKSNLKVVHMKYVYEDVRKLKCEVEECCYAAKRLGHLNRQFKYVDDKK